MNESILKKIEENCTVYAEPPSRNPNFIFSTDKDPIIKFLPRMFLSLSLEDPRRIRLTVDFTCTKSHFILIDSLLTLQNYSVKKPMYFSKEDASSLEIIQGDIEGVYQMSDMWNAFEIPFTVFFNAAVNDKIEIKFCGVVFMGDPINQIQHVPLPLRICDNSNKDFVIDIGKNYIKVS